MTQLYKRYNAHIIMGAVLEVFLSLCLSLFRNVHYFGYMTREIMGFLLLTDSCIFVQIVG